MIRETFHIPQLDCPQEFALIERRLAGLSGVGTMVPDYLRRELRVEFDPGQLVRRTIVNRIAEAGFAVADSRDEPRQAAIERLKGTAVAVASGLLLAALAFWLADRPVAAQGLGVAAALLAGAPVASAAWRAIRARSIDMYVLMTIAGVGALAIGETFEAATALVLFGVALWLERWSLDRARRALDDLAALQPEIAHRLELSPASASPPVIRDVSPDELTVGDVVLARPGERIPVDGLVIDGASAVDQATITGESLPVDKSRGETVFAGTLNGEGSLTIEVTRLARESTLARTARLVANAQASRSPTVRFVDRFARWYTPAVVALAAALVLGGYLGQQTGWLAPAEGGWLSRGLVMLVAACPCALVISTPVTLVAGLVGAARRGLLVKGGEFLERAGLIRCVVFDKTGTLTVGLPMVSAVEPVSGVARSELLQVAASLEAHSEHPLARAIVAAAEAEGVALAEVAGFAAERGRGVRGSIRGVECRVGNEAYARAGAPQTGPATTGVEVWVSRGAAPMGRIVLADAPKPEAREAVKRLAGLGVAHVELLSGDREAVVSQVASEVGIGAWRGGLLPEDKVARIGELMRSYDERVAMVGDGVNDAPALAASSLGIALGRGASEVALETADAASVSGDLRGVGALLALGQSCRRRLFENIAVSLSIKFAVLALAVVSLAPMWSAVAADVGATLLVIANGLRLARRA